MSLSVIARRRGPAAKGTSTIVPYCRVSVLNSPKRPLSCVYHTCLWSDVITVPYIYRSSRCTVAAASLPPDAACCVPSGEGYIRASPLFRSTLPSELLATSPNQRNPRVSALTLERQSVAKSCDT